jgi:hypothetical protein
MNQEQARNYLQRIVNKGEAPKHDYYDRVTKLADFYKIIITGEDADSLLKPYFKRQTVEDFTSLKSIYQTITPSLADPVIKTYHKVFRVAPKVKIVDWEETEANISNTVDVKERLKDIYKSLNNFYAGKTLEHWQSNDFLHSVFIDPNAFVLIRFDSYDADREKPDPYPVIISCHDAIDFKYTPKGILDYLLVQSKVDVDILYPNGTMEVIEVKMFTIYIKDWSYTITEIAKDNQVVPDGVEILGSINGKTKYYLQEYRTDAGQVQAMRVGYITDPYTHNHTYVSPLECARSWFMKTVKTVAELDITQTNHAFPQKIEYVEPCETDLSTGVCKISNQTQKGCQKCGGTGLCVVTSSQDIKVMKLPRDKEEMIDLDKMMVYKYPPVEIIKWMDDYIEKISVKVQKTVFNSETFTRDKVAKTATGENLDMQNVYDTLTPFAQQVSSVWEFVVKIVSNFMDYGDGLIVKYTYPNDFKLKSTWELLMELKTTQESGAPGNIRQTITDDIMRNFLQDDESEWIRYQSKMKHYPFNGKTDKEIQEAIANELVTKELQVLWANFENIFQELEVEQEQTNPDIWFYDLTFQIQTEKMNAKVEQIISQLEDQEVTATRFGAESDTDIE